jgi:hypothetical protein
MKILQPKNWQKKTLPILCLRRWGGTMNYNKLSTTCSFGNGVKPPFSCFDIEPGITFPCFIIKMVFYKLISSLSTSTTKCYVNINTYLHLFLNNLSWNQCSQIFNTYLHLLSRCPYLHISFIHNTMDTICIPPFFLMNLHMQKNTNTTFNFSSFLAFSSTKHKHKNYK